MSFSVNPINEYHNLMDQNSSTEFFIITNSKLSIHHHPNNIIMVCVCLQKDNLYVLKATNVDKPIRVTIYNVSFMNKNINKSTIYGFAQKKHECNFRTCFFNFNF